MALPNTRETTATPSGPVDSNTINAIQDCIIGDKRGAWWTEFLIAPRFANGWTVDTTGYLLSGGGLQGHANIPVDVGDRIIGFEFDALGNGAIQITAVGLSVITPVIGGSTMPGVGIGSVTAQTPPATWTSYAAVITPTVIAARSSLQLHFQANAAALRIGRIAIRRERL
jgi:hypothetical protein